MKMKNIIITGMPAIGKTTLIKKIIDKLNELHIDFDGFYTEEVKSNNQRIGFDVVTVRGQRGILARKGSKHPTANMPTVGQYSVHLRDFEKLALPVLEKPRKFLVIDEIGKMEMFSEKFQEKVKEIVDNEDIRMIATVPLKGGGLLVKQLKERDGSNLIMVNAISRDTLLNDIINLITE